MRNTRPLTITLTTQQARAVKARVDRGDYATESEVLRAGLRALEAQEAVMEDWLNRQIAIRYDAWQAKPTDTYTVSEVRAHLQQKVKLTGRKKP